MFSRFKHNLIVLVILGWLVIIAVVAANQPGLFLADVMQGKWIQYTNWADLIQDIRGNTIHLIPQIDLTQVSQIDMIVQYDPDVTTLLTPLSDHELFANQEQAHRLKIILRPTQSSLLAHTSLIRIPYRGESRVMISDLFVTQTDGKTLALSIEKS